MASPLTFIVPIIPGTTPQTIGAMLEQYMPILDQALTQIGTVHYARVLLLDAAQPNLQPGPTLSQSYRVAVVTEYDGSFDAYISDFAAVTGAFWDALFALVPGGSAIVPVAKNIPGFQAFVTTNDASQHPPNNTLYQAYPDLTVQQILADA
jgi:hypothetical protein